MYFNKTKFACKINIFQLPFTRSAYKEITASKVELKIQLLMCRAIISLKRNENFFLLKKLYEVFFHCGALMAKCCRYLTSDCKSNISGIGFHPNTHTF